MYKREEVIDFCLTLSNTYEDYPFQDMNWTVMRHKENRKMFASICSRLGNIWVNVKCEPIMIDMWRNLYKSVVPAYHMNKCHWNSIILDGLIPEEEIKNMIFDSYLLTKPKNRYFFAK